MTCEGVVLVCSCSGSCKGRENAVTATKEVAGVSATASTILAFDRLQQDVVHGLSAILAIPGDGWGMGHSCGQLWCATAAHAGEASACCTLRHSVSSTTGIANPRDIETTLHLVVPYSCDQNHMQK